MKRLLKSILSNRKVVNVDENTIHVTMYLKPEIFMNSGLVTASVNYNNSDKKYHTDINPYASINGPLSNYGELLEPPIKEEYEAFIDDCIFLIEAAGFTIISKKTSTNSTKSRYILMFGMKDNPCGSVIFDLRISDHPFDVSFPEELKDEALEYLKMNKVLDESATKAGINFVVEKVTVGSVKNDTWDRAFGRLDRLLTRMRRRVRKELNIRQH